MRPVTAAALGLAAFVLAGCGGLAAVKETLYSTGAKIGNRYCETRDPLLRDALIGRINGRLSGEGARFTLLGVACDDEPEAAPQG